MESARGPRRWLDRATFALTGLMFFAAFAVVRILAGLARIGRRRPADGPPDRVLMLPHDPIDQAGTRYRILAWAKRLRARGIRVRVAPPTTSGELRGLYGTRPQKMELLAVITFFRRLRQVISASRYDLVVFARSAFPRFPWGGPEMERLLVAVQPRTLLDLDDALWAYTPPARGLGPVPVVPDRTDRMMAMVHGVIAGNERIARRASRVNRNVRVVPTCVDPDATPTRTHVAQASPVVGWIGTPGNLRHLVGIVPALRRIAADRAIRLRVVSTVPFELPGVRVENVLWSAEIEAASVAGFDIGLMPLEAGPAFEGKCGLKLLQYAAAGVPAVASPVGVNADIVRHGETGLLATTEEEWVAALRSLVRDPERRARLGAAAREEARRRWSYLAWEGEFLAAMGLGKTTVPDATSQLQVAPAGAQATGESPLARPGPQPQVD